MKQSDRREVRKHRSKAVLADPSVERRRSSLAKYAEAYGISYRRGSMRPRLIP